VFWSLSWSCRARLCPVSLKLAIITTLRISRRAVPTGLFLMHVLCYCKWTVRFNVGSFNLALFALKWVFFKLRNVSIRQIGYLFIYYFYFFCVCRPEPAVPISVFRYALKTYSSTFKSPSSSCSWRWPVQHIFFCLQSLVLHSFSIAVWSQLSVFYVSHKQWSNIHFFL
jgi:hypothetical protein